MVRKGTMWCAQSTAMAASVVGTLAALSLLTRTATEGGCRGGIQILYKTEHPDFRRTMSKLNPKTFGFIQLFFGAFETRIRQNSLSAPPLGGCSTE